MRQPPCAGVSGCFAHLSGTGLAAGEQPQQGSVCATLLWSREEGVLCGQG